ncbi:AAA family ATPase [Spongiactinospora sp. TRM90649]|uniref:AAA family ATPase n=1 Tax=Spongiactinospora sp. TRM90649 TaxID=3031114 RepID=UPI0023F917E7|nr:AAA family ATPase [Spongiactinospora sp. TRM90649]MDF5758980.1 AAA family ATPase [Spongiactinospora sp. TRM90649]
MRITGIILCGPPASGKSTVTGALHELDPRFVLARSLVVGDDHADDHDQVTHEQVERLRAAGRIIADTRRDGNRYVIDRHPIEHIAQAGLVPVVHVGSSRDVEGLSVMGEWVRVLLVTPPEIRRERLRRRADDAGGPRLRGRQDAVGAVPPAADLRFHLRIATNVTPAEHAAREIADAFVAASRLARRRVAVGPVSGAG